MRWCVINLDTLNTPVGLNDVSVTVDISYLSGPPWPCKGRSAGVWVSQAFDDKRKIPLSWIHMVT